MKRRFSHDRGKVLIDLAVMLADGGEAMSNLAVLRDQPEIFGKVASDPTAWRVVAVTWPDEELLGLDVSELVHPAGVGQHRLRVAAVEDVGDVEAFGHHEVGSGFPSSARPPGYAWCQRNAFSEYEVLTFYGHAQQIGNELIEETRIAAVRTGGLLTSTVG